MHVLIGFAIVVGLLAMPATRKVIGVMAIIALIAGTITVINNGGFYTMARYEADRQKEAAAIHLSPAQLALVCDEPSDNPLCRKR